MVPSPGISETPKKPPNLDSNIDIQSCIEYKKWGRREGRRGKGSINKTDDGRCGVVTNCFSWRFRCTLVTESIPTRFTRSFTDRKRLGTSHLVPSRELAVYQVQYMRYIRFELAWMRRDITRKPIEIAAIAKSSHDPREARQKVLTYVLYIRTVDTYNVYLYQSIYTP